MSITIIDIKIGKTNTNFLVIQIINTWLSNNFFNYNSNK